MRIRTTRRKLVSAFEACMYNMTARDYRGMRLIWVSHRF